MRIENTCESTDEYTYVRSVLVLVLVSVSESVSVPVSVLVYQCHYLQEYSYYIHKKRPAQQVHQ